MRRPRGVHLRVRFQVWISDAGGCICRYNQPLANFRSRSAVAKEISRMPAASLVVQPTAAAYNSMSAMNHMRFECGVDLKALLKTSRKHLLKGLWAAPDSPDALAIGYMSYTGSH